MQYTYYGKGGNQTTSIFPKNSRPFSNTDVNGVTASSFGKPIPIKHWRKQLQPYYNTNSNQIPLDIINNPTTLNTTTVDNTNCNNVVEQIISTSTCDGTKNNNSCSGGTNHIRRSGSTNYSNNYCSSTRQYLQKRCKTFEQNMMIGTPIDIEQNLFNTTICPQKNDNKAKCVVYKQNNPSFSTIDSVVSSNYISKKKNNALNQNPYNPKKKLEHCSASCVSN